MFWISCFSYVYWTVHHLDSWVKRDQLDVTCFVISLLNAQHVSDVNTSETCWALSKEIIKQVSSSWSLLTQLSCFSFLMVYFVGSFFIICEFLSLLSPIIIVNINWYFYLLELSYDVTYCVFLSPPMNIYLLSVSILLCISFSLFVHCDVGLYNGRLFTVFIFKPWLNSSYCPTGCKLCFCLQLDLGYNNLSSLDRHLLGHWDVLKFLILEGNPWMCDCENQWMVSTLLPSVGEVIHDQLDSLQ